MEMSFRGSGVLSSNRRASSTRSRRLTGMAFRAPVSNVSVVDLTWGYSSKLIDLAAMMAR